MATLGICQRVPPDESAMIKRLVEEGNYASGLGHDIC
jgi:hypothetical protein